MPFTLAHTVAVIPIYKYFKNISAFSALIIGSMTPDFSYLTPFLVDQRMDSHSLIGIYLYAIPMGLTVYFLYHFLMAPVIVSLLPAKLQRHLHADLFLGKPPQIPSHILVFSIIVGALTHIVWDFFTHYSGIPYFIPWMEIPLATVDGYDIMPYRVLQHFSSLFGLSLLIYLIWRWYKRMHKHTAKTGSVKTNNIWQAPNSLKKIARYSLLIIPLTLGLVLGLINIPDSDVMYGMYSAQVFVRYAIIGAAAGFILSATLLGLLYQYHIRKQF